MCLHIFSHELYGNCLIIFQPFRILDTQSPRVSANLKHHLSGHANVKHHIVTTKRATCVGIPTAEINWCVVTIFLPLKVPVITFPQVQIPTNVPAYKTINHKLNHLKSPDYIHSPKTKQRSSVFVNGVNRRPNLGAVAGISGSNSRRLLAICFYNTAIRKGIPSTVSQLVKFSLRFDTFQNM